MTPWNNASIHPFFSLADGSRGLDPNYSTLAVLPAGQGGWCRVAHWPPATCPAPAAAVSRWRTTRKKNPTLLLVDDRTVAFLFTNFSSVFLVENLFTSVSCCYIQQIVLFIQNYSFSCEEWATELHSHASTNNVCCSYHNHYRCFFYLSLLKIWIDGKCATWILPSRRTAPDVGWSWLLKLDATVCNQTLVSEPERCPAPGCRNGFKNCPGDLTGHYISSSNQHKGKIWLH